MKLTACRLTSGLLEQLLLLLPEVLDDPGVVIDQALHQLAVRIRSAPRDHLQHAHHLAVAVHLAL